MEVKMANPQIKHNRNQKNIFTEKSGNSDVIKCAQVEDVRKH